MGRAKDEALTNQLIDYLLGESDGMPKVLYVYCYYCHTAVLKDLLNLFCPKIFGRHRLCFSLVSLGSRTYHSGSHSPSNFSFRKIRQEVTLVDVIVFLQAL